MIIFIRSDADYLMTFAYNVDKLTIGQVGDQLDVMIGNGDNCTHDYYRDNASDTPQKIINGTYLDAAFNANSTDSMFILEYWMNVGFLMGSKFA